VPDVLPNTFDDPIGMRSLQFSRTERWAKGKYENLLRLIHPPPRETDLTKNGKKFSAE
jgi:hypothetical protein